MTINDYNSLLVISTKYFSIFSFKLVECVVTIGMKNFPTRKNLSPGCQEKRVKKVFTIFLKSSISKDGLNSNGYFDKSN